jgi:prepilin-type N-terminal cleavage/methylation domain-containing protein
MNVFPQEQPPVANPPARAHARGARAARAGFTLTEIALAMAIFSFALVSMLGLLSVGLRNSRKANLQVSASNLLSSIVADIQSAQRVPLAENTTLFKCSKIPLTTTVTTQTQTNFKVGLDYIDPLILDEAGSPSNSILGRGLLKVFRVKFTPAASSVPAIRIRVSWPANLPDTAVPEGFLETIAALPIP